MAKQCRELPVRTMRSRLHRSQRDSEFLGDFAVGHAVEMMQANDCRFLMRQGLDRAPYPPDSIERIEVGRQGRRARGRSVRRPRAHSSGGAIPGDRCRWRHAWRWSPATAQDHDRHQNCSAACHTRTKVCCVASSARSCWPSTRCATAYTRRPYCWYSVRTAAGSRCRTRRATPDPRLHTLRRIGRSMRRSNAQVRAGLLGARDRAAAWPGVRARCAPSSP